MKKGRSIAIAAVLALAMVAGFVAVRKYAPPSARGDSAVIRLGPSAEIGGPFDLVDHRGRAVSDRDFLGRYVLIYFGYSFCPDICPTELQRMASALDALGAEGKAVVPVFITVDPERDTGKHLGAYVRAFHPRMVGLTGSKNAIAAAAKAYKVFYRKAGQGPDYLVDHTSFTYVVGPKGAVRVIFRTGTAPEAMARELRRLLHTLGNQPS